MAPAGDLSLVDTVAWGELQFFVPGVGLELFGEFEELKKCAVDLFLLFRVQRFEIRLFFSPFF